MASVTPVLWRALRDQWCFCRNWLSSSQSISHNSFLMDNTIFFLCGWTYHVILNLSLPRYIWFYTRTESWFCYCNHNLSSITMIIKPSHIEAYISLIPSLPGEVPSSPIALSNTLQSNFSSEYLCTNREFWGALCSISMSQHLADGSRVPKGWEYVLSHYSAHTLKTKPLSYCLALLIYIYAYVYLSILCSFHVIGKLLSGQGSEVSARLHYQLFFVVENWRLLYPSKKFPGS